jgi:hypothetical protein
MGGGGCSYSWSEPQEYFPSHYVSNQAKPKMASTIRICAHRTQLSDKELWDVDVPHESDSDNDVGQVWVIMNIIMMKKVETVLRKKWFNKGPIH